MHCCRHKPMISAQTTEAIVCFDIVDGIFPFFVDEDEVDLSPATFLHV